MNRIRSVEAIAVAVPTDNTEGDRSIMPSGWQNIDLVLVRVEDEAGHVGWGECFAYFCREPVASAVRTMVAPMVVGQIIDDIPAWNDRCQRALHLFGRAGVVMFALSGVDMALWDLKAKTEGCSLSALLGLEAKTVAAECYASLLRFDNPQRVHEAVSLTSQRGFLKSKVHEVEPASIEAGISALGSAGSLMIDCNCQLDDEAIAALRPLLSHDKVMWVEEPFFPPEDYEQLAALERSGVRVAAGENVVTPFHFSKLLDSATYVQPDIMKVGGVSAFLEIIELAADKGKVLMPHGAALGPGYFALLNLFPKLPPESLFEYFWIKTRVPIGQQTPRPERGWISFEPRLGIGFEPSSALLQHAVA